MFGAYGRLVGTEDVAETTMEQICEKLSQVIPNNNENIIFTSPKGFQNEHFWELESHLKAIEK